MFDETKDAYYLIEGEPMLSAIKQHIADRKTAIQARNALAKEFGAVQITYDWMTEKLIGCVFPEGKHHPDFRKPGRKDVCLPKAGSDASKKIVESPGIRNVESTISQAFGVPLSIRYAKGDMQGLSAIGRPFRACGFLYTGPDGPYALWVPDVPAYVNKRQQQGYTVETTFDMQLPGCRRILKEEWSLLVAQHQLKEAQAEKAQA